MSDQARYNAQRAEELRQKLVRLDASIEGNKRLRTEIVFSVDQLIRAQEHQYQRLHCEWTDLRHASLPEEVEGHKMDCSCDRNCTCFGHKTGLTALLEIK